jgi:hypothetical protein
MRFWLSLVVVAVVAGGVARGDNREDARKEFTAGQQADRNKDYQTAIEHYLRAYELVPHHFALYNIATAYERLGQLRESSQWFQRYLDEAPSSLVKERRDVEKLILQLKLRPAKLTVKTSPPGARVLIDGQPVGVTPYTKAIRGGGHRVRVELEGQREERDIVLEYGEPQAIDVTLNVRARPTPGPVPDRGGPSTQPIRHVPQTMTSGTLLVTGGPEGALVAIDDQVVGRIGGEFHVEPGQHNLKVTRYGYQPYDQTFSVTTGQRTDVSVQLQAGSSAPATASQALFGYYLGATVGADVRGSGAQYMGELGYRIMTIDIGLRIGKASSRTTLDVLFRWVILRSKLSPFIQLGCSAAAGDDDGSGSTSSLSGYVIGGGLRYDVARGESSAISVLAESGVRIIATSSASDDKTLFIPLLASLQVTFGGKTTR